MENIVIRPNNLLPIVGGLLLVFNLVWMALRKPLRFFFGANLFALYLVILVTLTILPFPFSVFKEPLPETILQPLRVNLYPFGIARLGNLMPHVTRVDWLNIAAFIPFGFLLPFTTKRGKLPIILFALLATLAIEVTQLVLTSRVPTYSRAFDVTDLITNVLGAWLGYMLSRPFFIKKSTTS
ncbi:MAG TPA: VanZ family protein [Anaerolineaceae bacterium]|nr:VanZ family protein [Anaerolineaceae bacterium]